MVAEPPSPAREFLSLPPPALKQTTLPEIMAAKAREARELAAMAVEDAASAAARAQRDQEESWWHYYHRRCKRPRCHSSMPPSCC